MMVSVSLMASESSLKRKRPPDDFYTPCGMTSGLTFQTELAKFSLANRASRESLSASDDVFHYTSADAFKEILSRGQIWLTNTAYLNDRNELRYPVELCQQIVQDKRDSYRLTLASLAQGGPPERSLLDRIHKEITLHEMFKPWYTASFSLEPNRLSQWRAYCGNGGYAIGFNTDKLAANFERTIRASSGPHLRKDRLCRTDTTRAARRSARSRPPTPETLGRDVS